MGASTQEFLTSAAAYAAVCLFVFLVFGYFRRLPATHHFYSPKRCALTFMKAHYTLLYYELVLDYAVACMLAQPAGNMRWSW